MSEDQIQAGGIELELSNTKKNLMEALNQNADLQKRLEERDRQIKAVGEALGLIGITVNHTNEDNKRTDWTIVDSVSRCVEEKDQRIRELEAEVAGLGGFIRSERCVDACRFIPNEALDAGIVEKMFKAFQLKLRLRDMRMPAEERNRIMDEGHQIIKEVAEIMEGMRGSGCSNSMR